MICASRLTGSSNPNFMHRAKAMMSWLADVLEGKGSGVAVIGEIPQQDFTSFVGITDSSWYDSIWLHLGWMMTLLALFISFYVSALICWIRRRPIRSSRSGASRLAAVVASMGLISVLGFFGYYGYIMMTQEPGPLIMGSPLPWIVLQILSIITLALILMLGVSTFKARAAMNRFEILQAALPLVGGLLFIPWSLYWKLLFPFV